MTRLLEKPKLARLRFWLVVGSGVVGVGCTPHDNLRDDFDNRVITGTTMGTYFRVEAVCAQSLDKHSIAAELNRLTLIFSTYQDDSELASVNASDTDVWINVNADLVLVANLAHRIHDASGGGFDPTVGRLVERWGFGSQSQTSMPEAEEIESIRGQVGYGSVETRMTPPAIKKHANVRLDFSGIAKGFAVDRLAELVLSAGCTNHLVDIGGDVRVNGHKASGGPWRIAIEDPLYPGKVIGYINRTAAALATSGTYLNVNTLNGKVFNHLIDPTTGYPVSHSLIAVSVLADNAMIADAWATGLMIKGIKDGHTLVEDWDLSALFLERTPEGELLIHRTGEFVNEFVEM